MSDAPNNDYHEQKLLAARELLVATRRDLQLVDDAIAALQDGREAVATATDTSTEHRAYWIGAVDDVDEQNGINVGSVQLASTHGLVNPKTGTIRNQDDAAFVCTNVLVAIAFADSPALFSKFLESESFHTSSLMLRLTDGATGRSLVTGMSTGPIGADRGVIPFSYFSSFRTGLGSNIKNGLFSEFTIPRNGVVKAEVFNVAALTFASSSSVRACVSLLGYKVYGA